MSAHDRVIVLVTEPEFHRAAEVFGSATGLRCVTVPSDEPALARAIAQHRARYIVVDLNLYAAARPEMEEKLDEFANYLRPLSKVDDTWLFEIASWPR